MESYLNLAERLVERRMLSDDELERVVKLQHEQPASLTRLMVELGFLSEDDLLPVLRDHFNIPLVSLREIPAVPLPIEFSANLGEFLKTARMVPVKVEGRDLIVATSDPFDIARLHALEVAVRIASDASVGKGKGNLCPYRGAYSAALLPPITLKAPLAAKSRARLTKRTLPICATWHQKCR